jgi:hypothetical protein
VDVRLAVPDATVSADVIDPALEAITRLNQKLIAKGQAPTFHDALSRGGVRWQPEPPGAERFDHAATVTRRGWGDCDDLAPWQAASLRFSGEDPGARATVYPSGPGRWHAVVRRSDGSIDDPSIDAGMRKHKGIRGIGIAPAVVSPMVAPQVIGDDTACRPSIALRPNRRIGGFEARVDIPWDETLYAMSVLNRAPVASQAVVGAICGALLVGEGGEIACERSMQRLAAVGLLLDGHHPYDVIHEVGLAAVVGAIPTLRAMAPVMGDTYYEVSDFVRRAVAPLTGPFRHQVEGDGSSMSAGETLTLKGDHTHQFLTSPNGQWRLVFQADGNLVLYGPGSAQEGHWGPALFSAQTNERGGSRLHMQSDGNLVIAGFDGKVKWASDTQGHPGASLHVLDSGDAQIVAPNGQTLWSARRDGLNTYRRKEGDFSFSELADVAKVITPILSKVVQFIPGVGPIASTAIDYGAQAATALLSAATKGDMGPAVDMLGKAAGPVVKNIVDIASKAIPLADQAKFVANSLVHAGIPIPPTMPAAVHAAAAVSPARHPIHRAAAAAPAPAAKPAPTPAAPKPAGVTAAPTAQVHPQAAAVTDAHAPIFQPIPKSAGMISIPGGPVILRF